MAFAPQHDWQYYEARTRESDAAWVRSLTPAERFALYDELYSAIMAVPRDPEEWARLERWQWEQKLALRLRMVEAFRKLDELRGERAAASDAD